MRVRAYELGASMCLFPLPNNRMDSPAYRKGVVEFECGACPECLRKKSSRLALRAYYETKAHERNCMICLTYDQWIRDGRGRIVGERLHSGEVVKRDVQLFIKRLRMFLDRTEGIKIKYYCAAEYGKKTHRPHYHVLIFGWSPLDCRFYKKSKRGNSIYRSPILERLWHQGICTVDSLNVTPSIARYCSKYALKDKGAQDVFQLQSNYIGLQGLLEDFDGKSYVVDGREYPVPRSVWENIIVQRYDPKREIIDPRYLNRSELSLSDGSFELNRRARELYRLVRDADPQYEDYIEYWHQKALQAESERPSVLSRIRLLDPKKYAVYKIKALKVYALRRAGVPVPAPGSKCVSAYNHYLDKIEMAQRRAHGELACFLGRSSLALSPSRPKRASDTILRRILHPRLEVREFDDVSHGPFPMFHVKQLTLLE